MPLEAMAEMIEEVLKCEIKLPFGKYMKFESKLTVVNAYLCGVNLAFYIQTYLRNN